MKRIAVLGTGEVLLGGVTGPESRSVGIVWLKPNGSYVPFRIYPFEKADTFDLDSEGRIVMLGGGFIGGRQVRRFNLDKQVDSGFHPAVSGNIWDLKVLPTGKILLVGNLVVENKSYSSIRLHPDGQTDLSWKAPNPIWEILSVDRFGRIYSVGLQGSVHRNLADGSVDSTFLVGFTKCDYGGCTLPGYARVVKTDCEDRIWMGGFFDRFGGDENLTGLIRLLPDGTLDRDFKPNFSERGTIYVGDLLFHGGEDFTAVGTYANDANLVAAAPNGKIYVVENNPGSKPVVTRYFGSSVATQPLRLLLEGEGRTLTLSLIGGTSPNVEIQRSASLKTWETVNRLNEYGGCLRLEIDAAVTNRAMFLRAVLIQ